MPALSKLRAARPAEQDFVFEPKAPFVLRSGALLADARVQVRRFGHAEAPAIVVMGGISATRDLDRWWGEIVGQGAAIDLERYAAIGVDFAPNGDERVAMTPNDQARLIEAALDELGLERAYAFVGASYGGMVGLALAAQAPHRLGRLCVISAAHEPSPLGSAWRGVQRRIAAFARDQGAMSEGLSLARQLAMITYRSAEEFESRFVRQLDETGESDLDRYLVSRGQAFTEAMGVNRWLSLSEAIDRARVDPALVKVPTTLIACSSDQLTPLTQMEQLSRQLPRLTAFHVIRSLYGHDAFLKEPVQISRLLRRFLDEARP